MAEFSLPRNSKVRKDGQVFKAPAGAKQRAAFQDLPLRSGHGREPAHR